MEGSRWGCPFLCAAGGVFCPRFEGRMWMFCIDGVFPPRFEGCMWMFCAGGRNRSVQIGPRWLWTFGESRENEPDLLTGSIQDFFISLYEKNNMQYAERHLGNMTEAKNYYRKVIENCSPEGAADAERLLKELEN